MATRTAGARQRRDFLSKVLEAAENFEGTNSKDVLTEPFLAAYYASASGEDLKDYNPADLVGAALSHLRLASVREGGEALVRVYNPRTKDMGWRSVHTVIETVAPDMPFLVDSVTMVAIEHGLTVHHTIHPVISTERDDQGQLKDVAERGNLPGGNDESFIHLEVDRVSNPDRLERIRQDVERALRDVTAAVGDWTAMRDRAEGLAYEMDPESSPLDPDELEEGRHFLHWLVDNHFTFLGYREYQLESHGNREVLRAEPRSGLGILRRRLAHNGEEALVLPRELRERARARELVIITKANSRSTVHRPAYLDYIGFKRFDENGNVCGERRFLGLFTSPVYSHSPREIPIVRRKIQHVLARSRLAPTSHAGKGLVHALETLPRDELFQASDEELYQLGMGILNIQERSRVRLFIRRDAFGRFYSCLIYVPRERYNSGVRERMQKILGETLGARQIDAFVHMGESRLARVHMIVHTRPWQRARIGHKRLERALSDATRTWDDRLRGALVRRYGEERGMRLFERWSKRFPLAYQEEVPPEKAPHDMRFMERLAGEDAIEISLYRPTASPEGVLRLKVFRREQPIIVSDILPLLENLGLKIIAERPYEVQLGDASIYWIHDFDTLVRSGSAPDPEDIQSRFREAFLALWHGRAEDDGINGLILSAGLDWMQTRIVRAYAKYLLQNGMPFGERYIEQVVSARPEVVRKLVELFEARFDPDLEEQARKSRVNTANTDVDAALEQLTGQDEDRILRALAACMRATLRTNHFRRAARGQPRHFLSFKLDPAKVPELPLPRPMFEIFVYAPHVEGVHLRGGRVARGGIRWSDRRADFRTEVLGLMKAQMVKNTVIVPVGAKGGFIAKHLPTGGDRDAVLTEVKRCYRDFIRGLLDLTDNIVGGRIRPPERTVRYDTDDPYLVVAADKGTATFSDLANEIAADYDFWLGDAFASGGSVGYDHKEIGITAKGAWESVRRLFRELGLDPDSDQISAVGIGDMAGDVFGNGMLLSKSLCLRAAFNHQHIFLDPNPDLAASFAERKRLFEMPRSSWEDYDREKISKGGGIFERSAKSIRLSKEAQDALGIEQTVATPQEVIRAILKAPIDLLWNGGIGTYVKSSHESNSEVGDRTNDAVRVNGCDLRARVVGEGGNLGFTQLGRIEYALAGGRITTDFIDNSAGVDCSDHEVNIKILLNLVRDQKRLREAERRKLLADMTSEVEQLVLRDNYLQSLALSVAESQSQTRIDEHAHLIRMLERQGHLNRQLEYLPAEDEIAERRVTGRGLTRPELAVLLAYSKIAVYNSMDEQALADDPHLRRELTDYFPSVLRKRYAELMPQHRLQADIIATAITNSMINRMGPNFPFRIQEETGASLNTVARAYTIAREGLEMLPLWRGLESLGAALPGQVQSAVIVATGHLVRHATRWLLEHGYGDASISNTVEFFGATTQILRSKLPEVLSENLQERFLSTRQQYVDIGLPDDLARRVAALPSLFAAFDVAEVAATTKLSVPDAAHAYFRLGAALDLDWLREQIELLPADDHWKALARATLREGLYAQQRRLAIQVLETATHETGSANERVADWLEHEQDTVRHFLSTLSEIRSTGQIEFASMSVALQETHSLARGGRAAGGLA